MELKECPGCGKLLPTAEKHKHRHRPDEWCDVITAGGADAYLIRVVQASQARMLTRDWSRYLVGGKQ